MAVTAHTRTRLIDLRLIGLLVAMADVARALKARNRQDPPNAEFRHLR